MDGIMEEPIKEETLQVSVSIELQQNADKTWTGWPTHADHLEFSDESRVEVIREILQATADCYEEA